MLWKAEQQAMMADLQERQAASEAALLSWAQLVQQLPQQVPGQLQEPGLVQSLGKALGLLWGQMLGLAGRLHT